MKRAEKLEPTIKRANTLISESFDIRGEEIDVEAKFSLGQVVATPGALEALEDARQQPSEFLARHLSGDWGDLDDEDRRLNDEALIDGSRLLSSYMTTAGTKLWLITEAVGDDGKRASSCLLLPEEY